MTVELWQMKPQTNDIQDVQAGVLFNPLNMENHGTSALRSVPLFW